MTHGRTSLVVEHRVDGWTFHIDASHAPHYVMVRGIGSPGPDTFLHSVRELQSVMDRLVGPGERFHPVIFDATRAHATRLSLPAILRAAPRLTRRLDRALVIGGPNHDGDFVGTFVRAMTSVNNRIQPVSSFEEALERLSAS